MNSSTFDVCLVLIYSLTHAWPFAPPSPWAPHRKTLAPPVCFPSMVCVHPMNSHAAKFPLIVSQKCWQCCPPTGYQPIAPCSRTSALPLGGCYFNCLTAKVSRICIVDLKNQPQNMCFFCCAYLRGMASQVSFHCIFIDIDKSPRIYVDVIYFLYWLIGHIDINTLITDNMYIDKCFWYSNRYISNR